MGVLIMSEKPLGTAFFMKDARRIDDLAEFRKECIKKRKCAKLYIIEKTIELSIIDYENFTSDLLADRQFISDNLEFMFSDTDNVWHCLLIVQAGKPDTGILVESKKFEFPMYAALYQKESKLKLIY